ncbi:MAG: purine-binding chemotaxis protein CheW [Lachnospiraceae bacterium]|nr:purine-binding chemotaxis protein CheW [Lachnospiraceae bacterium]
MSEELLEEFEDEQDTQKGMFMTFQMGEECYGIAVTFVQEIVGIQPITAVPEIEDYIKGLINIRGKIIPVIDVRVRFKQEPFEYTDRTCIIVINVKSTIIGLIVDKIAGVITVDEREIILPPSLSQSGSVSSKYVFGLAKVDDEVKLLLDPERLIRDEDIAAFGEAVPSTEVSAEA